MKKLLVAAIGAAAAIGAFADTPEPITELRFENATVGDTNTVSQLDALHKGSYWFDTGSADNTYVIESAGAVTSPMPLGSPTKALNVKTKFGNPLSVNVNDGGAAQTIGADGVYFDSLVKFTVCDDCPTNQYDGAKIVMWLQEDEAAGETNLYVNAGYLTYDGGVQVSNAIYKCGNPIGPDFADAWHRVTIKAIADITTDETVDVPGFAIFLDSEGATVNRVNCSSDEKWDSTFTNQFTFAEAVEELVKYKALFPSLDQTSANKLKMSKASFDGTGSITDIAFYNKSPDTFADDYVAPKVSLIVGELAQPGINTIEDAVAFINGNSVASGASITLMLSRDIEINGALTLQPVATDVTLVIDFNDHVIRNTSADAAAIVIGAFDVDEGEPSVVIRDTGANQSGGIYCVNDEAAAIDVGTGATILDIEGGNFWGVILANELDTAPITVSGGAFIDTSLDGKLAEGKEFAKTPSQETGLYAVIDYVPPTYTITVAGGEHFTVAVTTNEVAAGAAGAYVVTEGDSVAVTYTAETGYTLSKYEDGIDPVSETATIAAPVATLQTFNVIFVDGDSATTNVVNYGSGVGVVPAFKGRTGYTAAWDSDPTAVASVTSDLTFTAEYTANTYTVTFYTNSVKYAEAEYTYGNAGSYSAPADPSVSGYTFGGWYTDNGTFESEFTFSANVADNTQEAYAKLTSDGPTPIDPGSATPQTTVEADNEANAIKAATITPPAGVDAAAYKANFDFSAKSNGDGTYTVTMTGIKDSVTEGAASTAVAEVLSAATGESGDVTIPAGLYYKITTMTALDDKSPTVLKPSAPSTGKVNVTKPGTDKGFIKVELGTKAFE